MSSKIVELNTYVAAQEPAVGDAASQQPENGLIAIEQIYALLQECVAENIITSASAGTSVSQAMQKMAEIINQDYTKASQLYDAINSKSGVMKVLTPILVVVGIIAAVAGVIALVASFFFPPALAAVALYAGIIGGVAAIIGGGCGIAQGVLQIGVGDNEGQLANLNADVAKQNGAVQLSQSMSSWISGQVGQGASSLTNLSQSVSADIIAISNGLMTVNKDLAAVL